jgi:hypothetical protein
MLRLEEWAKERRDRRREKTGETGVGRARGERGKRELR